MVLARLYSSLGGRAGTEVPVRFSFGVTGGVCPFGTCCFFFCSEVVSLPVQKLKTCCELMAALPGKQKHSCSKQRALPLHRWAVRRFSAHSCDPKVQLGF